jgi:hypothetical protein
MEALNGAADPRPELRAFRAVDAFAVEAWKAARQIGRGEGEPLAAELRGQLARCGGALVALSVAGAPEGATATRLLGEARDALARCRFALYLARRLGLLDLRAYRSLATRADTAGRELPPRPP